MSDSPNKQRLWMGAGTVAGVLVIGSVLVSRIQPPPPVAPQAHARSEPPVHLARFLAPPGLHAVVAPNAVTPASGRSGAAATVRIEAGVVLASVNGTPIELKDLLPLAAGSEAAGQVMAADRYAYLLERAVDRELAFQQALAQGVDLSEPQLQQLAEMLARTQQPQANVFDDLQHSPANAAFEERAAAALLLQAALVERAGVPSRDVTAAQVEQYYQQHSSEFAALPGEPAKHQEAWADIDVEIRVKLARPAQTLHEQGAQRFIEQLRADAQIIKSNPAS